MEHRRLGKTGIKINPIGLGTWQVGGKWGQPFSHENAEAILHSAIEAGVNFIDTADVYGDRQSEKAVGKIIKAYNHPIYVATKCGRRIQPHNDENYTLASLRKHVEDSLQNMQIECIDLVQLHCAPNDTYYRPEIFELFEQLISEGKIKHFGVSVEKVEQGIKALEYNVVSSIQVIYNMFRHRPDEVLFPLAEKSNVGIIARIPLASGLLSGQYQIDTKFENGDHRHDNIEGKLFDKGETFSGVPYLTGIEAANALKHYFAERNLSTMAIIWPLHQKAVSCVIPGASNVSQIEQNMASYNHDLLSDEDVMMVKKIYAHSIKAHVHQQW